MTPEDGYLRRRRMKTSTMVDDNKTCSSQYRLNISMGTTTTTTSMRTSRPAPRPPSSTFLYSRPKGQVCCTPQPVIEYRQKGSPSLGFDDDLAVQQKDDDVHHCDFHLMTLSSSSTLSSLTETRLRPITTGEV